MLLIRLCGLLLVLQLFGWSASTPLHMQVKASPLMYLRLPIVWDREELNTLQEQNLKTALLESMTKPGKSGHAIRQFVGQLKGSLEFIALPPKNRFLPTPGLALRSQFMGSPEEMANKIQALIIAMVEDFQGTSASWLKFKRKVENGVITDSAFLLGRVTLMTEKDQFTLFFSQSNPEFPKLFKDKALSDIEASSKAVHKDATLFIDVENSMSFYKEWLKRVANPILEDLIKWGIVDLKTLAVWTEGESEGFKTKGRLVLNDNTDGMWNKLSSAKKKKAELPDQGSFTGSLLWPDLKASDWLKHIGLFSFISSNQRSGYSKLFESVSGPIAFSWDETSISPLITLDLKDSKVFESNLSKLIAPKGKITKEAGSGLRHVLWDKNSVSYRISGNKLTFSPLLQALRDQKTKGPSFDQDQLLKVNYPLDGNLSGNYYTIMHLVLQSVVSSGKTLDPKIFPSFSSLNLKEREWYGQGSIELRRNKQNLDIDWKQPFGLPGLVSGVKLPSSSWINFLSLATLTSKSVKF